VIVPRFRQRPRGGAVLLALGVFILLLSGCNGQKSMVVDLTYLPPDAAAAAESVDRVVVHLSPIADERSNRETIGRTTVSILPRSNVINWVQDGLLTLEDRGFDLSFSGSDPPDGYRLRVGVSRVYCQSTLRALRATVILSVSYFRDGVLLKESLHVGESIVEETSFFGDPYKFSNGTIRRALNEGLNDTVAQIAATIRELEAP
jgi:uncharacterized lipoprotein YajG